MKMVYRITTVNIQGDSKNEYFVGPSNLDDGKVLIAYRRLSGNKDKHIAIVREGLAYTA